jgi:hypothetical protein
MQGGEVQFNNEGLFTIRRQTKEMFDVFEYALNHIKEREERLTNTSQRLKKDVETIQSETGNLEVPVLTSGKIVLSDKKLNNLLVDNFLSVSDRFEFADTRREEGPFFWNATAMDTKKNSVFGISSNGKEIALIPQADCTFESFLDFYRQVLEEIDDRASLKTFGV